MDKSNLDLFKQALSEGLSNKFDKVADSCTEEITYSREHEIAMNAIINGKVAEKVTKRRAWTPKMKQIIALLIAAALLLASCAIVVYRNEIRDIIEKAHEFFTRLTYSDENTDGATIEEVYELTYVPEGYYLEETTTIPIKTKYVFKNPNGDEISFEQCILDNASFFVDNEPDDKVIFTINNHDVYHRNTQKRHYYLWNDGKYVLELASTVEISNEELQLIIDGIVVK